MANRLLILNAATGEFNLNSTSVKHNYTSVKYNCTTVYLFVHAFSFKRKKIRNITTVKSKNNEKMKDKNKMKYLTKDECDNSSNG